MRHRWCVTERTEGFIEQHVGRGSRCPGHPEACPWAYIFKIAMVSEHD